MLYCIIAIKQLYKTSAGIWIGGIIECVYFIKMFFSFYGLIRHIYLKMEKKRQNTVAVCNKVFENFRFKNENITMNMKSVHFSSKEYNFST